MTQQEFSQKEQFIQAKNRLHTAIGKVKELLSEKEELLNNNQSSDDAKDVINSEFVTKLQQQIIELTADYDQRNLEFEQLNDKYQDLNKVSKKSLAVIDHVINELTVIMQKNDDSAVQKIADDLLINNLSEDLSADNLSDDM